MKKIVNIEGMCCERCAKRVENLLAAVPKVVSVDVKLKKKIAIIRSREEVDNEELYRAVENAGFKILSIELK